MNNVVLIGRLTRDPELRYVAESQMAVATFTLAIDRPVRAGQEKKADFPRITVFDRQAENCERFLSKGSQVAVLGRIQTGSYTNKDGQTVYTTEVVANRVEFLGSGNNSGGGQQGYQGYQQSGSYQSGGYQQPAPQAQQAPAGGDMGIPEGFQAIQDDDIPF